ncbi:MAG: MYXO-CTERM sorting domain-containing protein [Myxococcales bacterium]
MSRLGAIVLSLAWLLWPLPARADISVVASAASGMAVPLAMIVVGVLLLVRRRKD